jgi:hypothetical protein
MLATMARGGTARGNQTNAGRKYVMGGRDWADEIRDYPSFPGEGPDDYLNRRSKPISFNGTAHKLGAAVEPTHQGGHDAVDIEIHDAASIFGKEIPPRGWLLGNAFCKQFLSELIGAGGTAKTAVRLVQALSVAIGRSLTGEHVHKRARVLFLSFEDGETELERRLLAAMRHHRIPKNEVAGWFFFATVTRYKLIKTDDHGNRVAGPLDTWLRRAIKDFGVELVIFDPFIKTHGEEENDNTAIDAVCASLARLGVELDIAVDFLHHVKKGIPEPGNADAGRGASAAKDAGRLVYTLTPISKDEAALFNITEEALRRSLVRMDSGKVNIVPSGLGEIWFRIVGVPLDNGTPEYPNGDNVQTVERWTLPNVFKTISTATANQILDSINQGAGEGQRYSPAPQAKDRAAWPVVQNFCPDFTEKQCKHVIATWLKNGVLKSDEYDDPKFRHPRKGLFVAERPGDSWEQ